ncbi:putative membrane protein [Cytobacillus eiseniae]|uniref:Membrane protein n=1 Tax=Cytobacillus eiseniae TaxID=762947 RepID=A0ABS4R9N1_9BACI|nr:AmiS/UreI family transporter [Cytobacillus eiseniae]MBP2239600.1 putative membrane protein [Cytobacillus eiseniae]
MGTIGLFLSGATLFLNSLMLLGKANGKSVAVFNLFIGTLQVVTPFYLILVSDQSSLSIFNYGVTYLFGFTFLYFGVITLKGYDGNGLGWFSLWISIITIVYAIVAITRSQDVLGMLTWIHWSFLWLLFFLTMTMKKAIDNFVGMVAQIQSWLTLTIPSLFSMLGIMEITWIRNLLIGALILSIFIFIGSAWTLRKKTAINAGPVHN